jgi:hypothetical protein
MSSVKDPPKEEVKEIRYRIVFMPNDDFDLFKALLGKKVLEYDYLKEKNIDTLMTVVGEAVYVPDRHKPFLLGQAKKGNPL